MRRVLAGLALALVGAVAVPESPSAAGAAMTASTQDAMNHAAVVIDTGDGHVRKLCLAFPEAEVSGIEALQRVDTRPHRFETFSGKGSGVCMLCGVGCASGDCFCNPNKYWAYHRSGPTETQYRASSLGASSTVVRDGDVEAWKWGTGAAPVKTTVSEVCGVPEPPARTTSGATTTSTTSTTAQQPPTTEATESPSHSTPTRAQPPPTTTTPGAGRPGATGTPTTTPPRPGVPDPTPGAPSEAPPDDQAQEAAAAPSGAEVKRSLGAEEGAAAATGSEGGRSVGEQASLGAFAALLGGLLVWRARLRRAKVRRGRPVR